MKNKRYFSKDFDQKMSQFDHITKENSDWKSPWSKSSPVFNLKSHIKMSRACHFVWISRFFPLCDWQLGCIQVWTKHKNQWFFKGSIFILFGWPWQPSSVQKSINVLYMILALEIDREWQIQRNGKIKQAVRKLMAKIFLQIIERGEAESLSRFTFYHC